MLRDQLGDWLELQRRKSSMWLKALFGFLAVLVVLNVFIHPHHPHFGLDKYPGFWAAFGLGFGVVMILVLKKGLGPLVGKPEDYYDRDE